MALIRLVDYRIMLMGFLLTIVFWLLIWSGLFQPTKDVLEIAAVVVTALFTFGLFVRLAFGRHLFLLWAVLFMALAMCREIHFSGSDEALLIGWPALLVVVLWQYEIYKSYLKNPVLIKMLGWRFSCANYRRSSARNHKHIAGNRAQSFQVIWGHPGEPLAHIVNGGFTHPQGNLLL